jgi:hypothetical protein
MLHPIFCPPTEIPKRGEATDENRGGGAAIEKPSLFPDNNGGSGMLPTPERYAECEE